MRTLWVRDEMDDAARSVLHSFIRSLEAWPRARCRGVGPPHHWKALLDACRCPPFLGQAMPIVL